MTTPPRSWQELGRAVLAERLAAGYSDTAEWAAKVGRSTRMLLGLERGEQVGPKTLSLIEAALDKRPGWAYRFLAGADEEPASPVRQVVPAPPKLRAVPAEVENAVIKAIKEDTSLSEESREHFLNQYRLLRKIPHDPPQQSVPDSPSERLPYVAHGRRTGPVDPEEEARIEAEARRAAEENPHSPVGEGPVPPERDV